MIEITFPDGSKKEYPEGVTPYEVARSISEGLARNVISASADGKTIEVTTPLNENTSLVLYTWDDEAGKRAFWHSSAHVLAQAILRFYPEAKLTIGPAIENGFYYDIDFGQEKFTEADFKKVEDKFLELAREKNDFRLRSVSKDQALDYYEKEHNPYKVEMIQALEDGTISFCDHGDFTDLCRGGHIPNTGLIKAVKITSVAGAYWRGDEKNKQLTRVYAISFPQAKMLTEYLQRMEEAKKRDHRKLGKELELFTFSQKVGAGLPLWLPKGTALRRRLEDFLTAAQKRAGYEMVITPHIGAKQLYVTSGHFAKYGKDSFQPIHTPEDGEEYLLKPMNCPHHCEIFNSHQWSYRDLPKRYAEFGTVYRYEQSGELHGLTRVRGFTQDDAHLFCTPDQLLEEFENVIDLVKYVFESLGFNEYTAQVSLRDPNNPDKYIGSDENWEKAENAIIRAAKDKGLKTVVEYGEAAFYGPKLDFMVRDAIGRKWQLGTIQVDYNLPERFDLSYIGPDNQPHRPVMIHRAPFGSMERFIAILLESTAGVFPLWLTPQQGVVLPISDKYNDYAKQVADALNAKDVRVEVDYRGEKIGKKIRDAEVQKIPFMIVVGEKEQADGTISVRRHTQGDLGQMTVEALAAAVNDEVSHSIKQFK